MATVFSQFDTTPATLVADLKTRILLSSDWSNPAGQRVVATTTRTAPMVVDLADTAATSVRLGLGVYRTAALADKTLRYVPWRASGGATSDPLHVRVSAGKDHLYFDIEGPRLGEANPSSASQGTHRCPFFIGELTPYFASDTVPTVALVASTSQVAFIDEVVSVGRNQGDNSSWVPAHLLSLHPPVMSTSGAPLTAIGGVQRVAVNDSKTYLFPYVVSETADGLRGRLSKCFFAGFSAPGGSTQTSVVPAQFSRATYGGEAYTLLATERYASVIVSPFGRHDSNDLSPVIAVPTA